MCLIWTISGVEQSRDWLIGWDIKSYQILGSSYFSALPLSIRSLSSNSPHDRKKPTVVLHISRLKERKQEKKKKDDFFCLAHFETRPNQTKYLSYVIHWQRE